MSRKITYQFQTEQSKISKILLAAARAGNVWARDQLEIHFHCRVANNIQLQRINRDRRRGNLDPRTSWL